MTESTLLALLGNFLQLHYNRFVNARTRFLASLTLVFFCGLPSTWADTVVFRDGRVWTGIVLSQNERVVELDLGFDVARLEHEKIACIERSTEKEARLLRQRLDRIKKECQKRRDANRPTIYPYVENGRLFADALINGKVKAKLLMDTGSSVVVLSPAIARRLGIDPRSGKSVGLTMADGRKLKTRWVRLNRVKVQEAQAFLVEAAVLSEDIPEVIKSDGLLGMNFLSRFNVRINAGGPAEKGNT